MRMFELLKLRTRCREKATGLMGMVTHWIMDTSGVVRYFFQPEGLDEHGQPVPKLCVCIAQLQVRKAHFEKVKVPFQILGSQVTDTASKFSGMATFFIRHPNGCFHVEIQPKGKLAKKGTPIYPCDFDLRQCKGRMIPVLTERARKKSEKKEPSPSFLSMHRAFQETSPARGGGTARSVMHAQPTRSVR